MKPTKKRKALSALMVLTMLVGLLPVGSVSVYAAEPAADDGNTATVATTAENTAVPTADITGTTVGGFIVNGGTLDTDYSYDEASGTLTILTSTPLTISTYNPEADSYYTYDHIAIDENVNADLTFAYVSIYSTESPVDVPAGASLTLTLAEGYGNLLRNEEDFSGSGKPDNAGIHVPEGATLTIQCGAHGANCPGDETCGRLTVGDNYSGSRAAAIGGNSGWYTTDGNPNGEDAGTVTINGGRLTLQTGSSASGIGGGSGTNDGDGGDGGSVTINGGYVTGSRDYEDDEMIIGGGVKGYSDGVQDGAGGTLTLNGGVLAHTGTRTADGASALALTVDGGQVQNCTLSNGSYDFQSGSITDTTINNITSWNDAALASGALTVSGCTLDLEEDANAIKNGGEGNTFSSPMTIVDEAVYGDKTVFDNAVTVSGSGTFNGTTTFNGEVTINGNSTFVGATTFNGPVTFEGACTFGTETNFNNKTVSWDEVTPNTVTINAPQQFTGTTNFNNSSVVINDAVTTSGTTTMHSAVTLNGPLTNKGALTIASGSTLTNTDTLTNDADATLHLYGTIDNENGTSEGTLTNNGTLYIYEGGQILNNDQVVTPNAPIDASSRPIPAGEVVIDLDEVSGQYIKIGKDSYTIDNDFNDENPGRTFPYDPAKNTIVLTGEWTGSVGNRQSVVTLEAGLTATVILRDATFNVEADSNDYGYAAALALSDNCTTTLLLEGTNTVTPVKDTSKTDNRSIAIRTASTSSLTIDGDDDGTLNLNYEGTSWRFGIGNSEGTMGTITVNGGCFTSEVNSDNGQMGNGYGLFYGHGGTLIFNNGEITGEMFIAPRMIWGAGNVGINVTINGGDINVVHEDGSENNGSGTYSQVTINGGSVSVPSLHVNNLQVNGGELMTDVYMTNGNNFVINGGIVTVDGTRIDPGWSPNPDYRRTPTAITGGSVKMIYNEGTQEVKLANVGSYYLTELTGQSGVTSVTVDGVNQNIAANHPEDNTLYLYLQHDDSTTSHTIDVLRGHTKTTYTATWNNEKECYDVEQSGEEEVTPSEDELEMKIDGATENASGELEKVVGDNEPLIITVDLSKVAAEQTPPSNSLINRPSTPENDLGYDWNTVILYRDGERIKSQLVQSGQKTAVFYVQTETLGVGEHRFQATYAAQGTSTELALSNEMTVNIVQASLEGADVTPPTLSGTYGDKISALTIDGGSVTLGGDTIDGKWTITDKDQDSVLDVDTKEQVALTFTPTNKRYASITQKVTPSISKKTLTASISGTPSKTYDGTTAYNEELMIALTGVVSGDTVTATATSVSFNDASAGTDKTVTATGVVLGGTDADNYTLGDITTLTTTNGSITKADATAKAGTLSVKNGYAASYTFDLTALHPALTAPAALGEVSYALDTVSLDGYYTSGAKIDENKLTIPINAVESDDVKEIGTISVTIKSDNYNDMTATITVSAVNRAEQTKPDANEGYSINYTTEQITAAEGYELAESDTATSGSETLMATPDETVYVRKAGNATYQPSAWTAINLPARPEAPAAPAIEKSRDSIIVSEVSGQEYKLGEDGAWQDSSAFTGLNAGTDYTISIRTAATEDDFASETVSVSVTTLNENGSGIVADGETAILPDGTTAKNDDGKIIITDENDNITTIQPAPATGVDIDENGNVQAPEGSTVTTGDTTVTIGDKGAGVEPNGDIILPGGGSAAIGDSTITAPESGGTVTVDEGGNITLPGGSTVTSGGETVTLPPEGGILTPGGDLTYGVTVTFDSQGGTAVPAQENIPVGETATEPARPSKGDNTFTGWYTDPACTQRWDFSQPVTADMTLYAGGTPYTGSYSYEIFTDVGENGTIRVDRYATEGERVTITVSPDEAYLLDELTVISGGKDVELTDHGDGTYSFTMPSGDVAITATFAEDPNWSEPEEPATDVSEIFTDVPADHWARAVIQYVYDNGLMTGTSATTFAPEATTTRGMIVSMLARLEGVTSAEPAGFKDVSADDWYATAVNWAASAGIVNGYEDNTFQPNAAITREQLAAMLMNYAQWKGQDTSARADLSHYSDADSISSWANDVLSWAVAEGLLTGVTDDTIAPQVHATRAQVAAILQRFLSE